MRIRKRTRDDVLADFDSMSTLGSVSDSDKKFKQIKTKTGGFALDHARGASDSTLQKMAEAAGVDWINDGSSVTPDIPTPTVGSKPSAPSVTPDIPTPTVGSKPSAPSPPSNIGSGFKPSQTSNTSSNQTSAGRLNEMLGSGSPLMDRAATQGKQMANSRGLLNSSMAAGASQGAMIDRASPFALQDSNNMYRENQFNAQQANAFGQQHNDFVGRGQLADQGYQHQYGLNNQQFQNTGFLNDQQYLHDLGRATHGFDIQSALNDQGYIQNVGLIGAELGANQQMSAQDFMEQYQLAQQQGNISSDMSYQDFMQRAGLNQQMGGINSNQSYQDFREQIGLDDNSFGNQRTLNQDEYNFRSNMSEQDFNEQLGVAAQNFGFQTELADQTFNNTMQELRASFSANAWGVMGNNIVNTLGDSAKMIDAIQLDPNISADDKESLIADIQERTGTMVDIQQGLLGEFGDFLDNTGAFPDASSGSSGNAPGGSDGGGAGSGAGGAANGGSGDGSSNDADGSGNNSFDTSTYIMNKMSQLNETQEDGRSNWTMAEVRQAFEDAGLSPQEHYEMYGRDEGISPN